MMIIPQTEISKQTPYLGSLFVRWAEFMYSRVRFNMPDSIVHAHAHCERVLLHALAIGNALFGEDEVALTILAHASVFHDTRRQDEYLDRGHGARAAVYYREFCGANDDIRYYPEAAFLMRFHDMDDDFGIAAIKKVFGDDAERCLKLYAIFKDADALDRWRLGPRGLDIRFLRTAKARELNDYARALVVSTMPMNIRKALWDAVERLWRKG